MLKRTLLTVAMAIAATATFFALSWPTPQAEAQVTYLLQGEPGPTYCGSNSCSMGEVCLLQGSPGSTAGMCMCP